MTDRDDHTPRTDDPEPTPDRSSARRPAADGGRPNERRADGGRPYERRGDSGRSNEHRVDGGRPERPRADGGRPNEHRGDGGRPDPSGAGGGSGSDAIFENREEAELDRGPFQRWVADSIKNPKRVYRAMFYVATIFFLVTTLFPFYWLLMVALTPEGQLQDIVFTPNGFNPGAFVEVFETIPFHWYMFNSFVIATLTTAIVLLVGSLAGYAFGRLDFPAKTPLMMLILIISFFPPAAFFIPLNDLFNTELFFLEPITASGTLYNTPGAMVMPMSAIFMPLAIFILTTFYAQIPDGLEDAARVEGTTRLGALFRVIIPLSAPGVATAGVLTFIAVYNEFFFSFLMTNGQPENWAPILEGILAYQGQYEVLYNLMAAASILGVIPVAILVVVAQEKIVSGLTAGALKE